MALSQAADGQLHCSHIRKEVVKTNEGNRSLTFDLKKKNYTKHSSSKWFGSKNQL